MRCGDTFLMPAPGIGPTPHLWVVITDPDDDDGRCVIVSVTTLRHGVDQTVFLSPGDHPFIRHRSVIYYIDARMVSAQKIDAEAGIGLVEPKGS